MATCWAWGCARWAKASRYCSVMAPTARWGSEGSLEGPHGAGPLSRPSPAARLPLLKWRLPARLQPGRVT